jgi:hypothetical protein
MKGESMRVPEQSSFLQKVNALLVVAGKQTAKIYTLKKGVVEPTAAVRIDPSEYTDKPSSFRDGNSGEVQREDDQYIISQFLKQLTGVLEKVDVSERLYLFAPKQVMKKIKEALPVSLASKIADEFPGNFIKARTGELVEKIVVHSEEIKVGQSKRSISAEAEKILHRPHHTVSGA